MPQMCMAEHPSTYSTCILVQLHTCRVLCLHLQRLQRYCANEILLTQQNKHTYIQTLTGILETTYTIVHTTRYISRTTFWFVDTHKHTDTQTDTLKTIPAVATAASVQ